MKLDLAAILWHRQKIAPPYGAVGDLLWVRETFSPVYGYEPDFSLLREAWYWADGNPTDGDWMKPKPSIHMPRWASRITLEITGVRVERLHNISEADARAEGITDGGCTRCGNSEPCRCSNPSPNARDAFAWLWHQINGAESWHENPWVWVLEFKVHKRNVDELMAAPL